MARLGWQVPIWLLLPSVGVQWLQAEWPTVALFTPAFLYGMLAAMFYGLWLYEKGKSEQAVASWFAVVGGVVLIGWLGGHFFRIRGLEMWAWQWTILTLMATWVSDSAAYLVGSFLAGKFILGRHQFSPRLSPNKTVEGYTGGVVLGTAVVIIIAGILQVPLLPALILGVVVSSIGPFGDLSISLLKRVSGVKDSGHLFPGHGGALDRLDSLIWSISIGYYLAAVFF